MQAWAVKRLHYYMWQESSKSV